MSSTLKSIFAGERAQGRLQAALFTGTSTEPEAETISELVDTLNSEHKADEAKCASINMKVGRMAHKVAQDLELVKGKYSVPAIKLDDDGVFYSEMVKTRATTKNPLMDAVKAFQKNPTVANAGKVNKIMLRMTEEAEKAKNDSK